MEQYLVLYPNGFLNWIETSRREMCANFRKAIGCDFLENVTLPYGFCCIVDESGKIKEEPQPLNPLASRLYPGSFYGDPLVGPVVFARIDLIDGEPDWAPLNDRDIMVLELIIGKKVPERGKV